MDDNIIPFPKKDRPLDASPAWPLDEWSGTLGLCAKLLGERARDYGAARTPESREKFLAMLGDAEKIVRSIRDLTERGSPGFWYQT